MAESRGFFWRVPPSVLKQGIAKYGEDAIAAAKADCDYIAQQMQAYARVNAPWRDRSGNARRGLFSIAEIEGQKIVIYLSHTVSYGIFLETGHSGRYQIIQPTVEKHLPILEQMLRDTFSG